MKKSKLIILGIIVLFLLSGAGIVVMSAMKTDKEPEKDESTFAVATDVEVFQTVPKMEGESISITDARDIGDDSYMLYGENTTFEEYQDYLALLEKNGFAKQVDNGEKGIDEKVYLAHYVKDDLLVTVTYFVNFEKTMITATNNTLLSPNLVYDESYVADNKNGAQTKFHLPELWTAGNSFVFQLKNGHFILHDGGVKAELPYLLDYLESLVPEGEVPVIEAWFITHAHLDHHGVALGLIENKEYADRIRVNSIYYSDPGKDVKDLFARSSEKVSSLALYAQNVSNALKTSDGDHPKLYKPRVGERYYFNDISIEMVYTAELLEPSEWKTWNAGSFVQMFYIEGQKLLITGDTEFECQEIIMKTFDRSYFNLDFYQAPHHGLNVHNEFSNYFSEIKTVIYPSVRLNSASSEDSYLGRRVQNAYLKSIAQEAYSFWDGTKIFTFPYTVGSAECLPERTAEQWIYNNSEKPTWKPKTN